MNKLGLLIASLLWISCPAIAEDFKTADEAVKKLSGYTVADIEGDKIRHKENKELKIDLMFNDLENAAKLSQKDSLNEDLAFQMERVALITFIHDPSAFAVDLILPVYQKNKAIFEKAAQKLHPVDRALILDTLESHSKTTTEGNG